MNIIVLCIYLGTMITALIPAESLAYRDYLTTEQKSHLAKIQTVGVEAIALSDKGALDPAPIVDLVATRLGELGYMVVRESGKPLDAVLKVKCEERKTWEGTTVAGGDADLPDAPSRLWKGPACQLTYLLGDTRIRWQKEVRTNFEDPAAAALAANAGDHSDYTIAQLLQKLEEYDFPVLLAAEWGQPERLLKLLNATGTPQTRKIKIISLLGQMQADEAMPKLKEALKDRELNQEAAVALGNLGSEGIPILVDILKTSNQPDLQAAAAKGLGKIGGITGDGRVVDPLLSMLDAPGIDIRVQTEIVWALGKVPDKRSLAPLKALFKKVLHIREPENKELQSLKEALNWSTKQLDLDEHLS